jgi:hypothetical protein
MVRDNRVKEYGFSQSNLTVTGGSKIDVYSDHSLNGVIQAISWKAGNVAATGSIIVNVSGMGDESNILVMSSGTSTGHHLEEDWVVFPRATTVTTSSIPISGANGYNEFGMIPVNSTIRVIGSGLGVSGTYGEELRIVYI